MRRDRRVQHLAEEIAEGRRGRSQLERIEEAERRCLRRVFEIERDDTAVKTAELALRELVLRMVRETGIPDARDLLMRREMLSDAQRALALTAHAQLERAHAADAEPGLVRREVRPVQDRAVAHRLRDLRASRDAARHHVAVAVHVLRQRMDHDVGTDRRGTEQHG